MRRGIYDRVNATVDDKLATGCQMAGNRKKFKSGDIDKVRLALLHKIYEDDDDDERYIKRQAIKQLMGVIIAARKSGISFEDIVETFTAEGLEISASTLRSYYFDHKADTEASRVTVRQVNRITETRERLSASNVAKKGHEAHRKAVTAAKKMAAAPKLVLASDLPEQNTPQITSKTVSPPKPAGQLREVPPQKPIAAENKTTTGGRAPTIEDLRRLSVGAEGKEELTEDVILQMDGRVYYASGETFDGILTTRQIRLLETTRRLVAPHKGSGGQRTAKNFTVMPKEL